MKVKGFFTCMVGGLLCSTAFLSAPITEAAPLMTDKQTVEQPNGLSFEVSVKGDDYSGYYVTNDDAIVKRNSDGYWYYETIESYRNNEKGSNRYGIDKMPANALTEKEIEQESEKNAKNFLPKETAQLRALPKWNENQNLLVILVEFEDQKLSSTEEEWHQKIFGETGKTMRTYYQEQTEGQLNITPVEDSYGASNGVVTVTLDQKHPRKGLVPEYNSSTQVMEAALKKADEFVNFAQYDTNYPSSNYLEQNELHVMAIYAGHESSLQAAGSTEPSVRGHKGTFYNYAGPFDGKLLDHYTTFGEKMDFGASYGNGGTQLSSIGVIAHEFGHDLRLPDLYNTSNSGRGLGASSLMATGSWNAENGELAGETPAGLDAYSKEQLGMAVQIVDPEEDGIYELRTILNKTDKATILRINTSNPNEYFLIENRQFEGFDKGYQRNMYHSGGIAVYRVNKKFAQNIRVGEQLVTLLEAEQNITGYSKMDTNNPWYGDPFYYVGTGIHKRDQATTITRTTNPSTQLFDGTTYGDFALEVLDAPASQMRVKISKYRSVEGIAFDFAEKEIEAGQSFEAAPSIMPENATNKKVSWQSSDETVATVDEAGKISGLKAGTVTIKAISEDGAKEASFQLTVTRIPIEIEDIIIDETIVFVDVNESKNAPISLQPADAYLDELTWTIKNTSLASVNKTGVITGLEKGATTLQVATKDGRIVKEVTVLVGDDHGNTNEHATPIKLDETIKAEMEYKKDLDRFRLDFGEANVSAVVIESPTGYIWSGTTENAVYTGKKVTHNGMYYTIINNGKAMERLTVAFYSDSLFGTNNIGNYEFKVTTLTEDQLKAPTISELPMLEVGQSIDLKDYTEVYNSYIDTAEYSLSIDDKGAVELSSDGILTAKRSTGKFFINTTDIFTGAKRAYAQSTSVKDDHGNTNEEATQIKFDQVVKAEMEYKKDIDRFKIDIGETKVKTAIVASPTGYIWSATSGGETIFSVKKVKHNGMYYSIVNGSKVIEKLNVSFYFDSLDIKEYEFKVSPVTEEQLLKINQNDFSDFENF